MQERCGVGIDEVVVVRPRSLLVDRYPAAMPEEPLFASGGA